MGKFLNSIYNFISNVKQIKIDIQNRKKFLVDIAREQRDVNSTFNKYKLFCDSDYNTISCVIPIPENFQLSGTDLQIYDKLQDEVRPINTYIGTELNWGEYFVAPEFFHIEDEDSDNNINQSELKKMVSCTYLAIWRYTPVILTNKRFWVQFTSVVIGLIAIIAGITAAGIILL